MYANTPINAGLMPKNMKTLGFCCGSLDFGADEAGIARRLIGAFLRVGAWGCGRKGQEWCKGWEGGGKEGKRG